MDQSVGADLAAQEPPPGMALSLRATRGALLRYAMRSAGVALIGVATVAGGALSLASHARVTRSGPVHEVLVAVVGIGLVPMCAGLLGLVNLPRMRYLAARHPWHVWDGTYEVLAQGRGWPALLPAGKDGRALSVVAWRWNWGVLSPGRGPVWYAGDPLRGPVLAAPPGGAVLLWARPSRMLRRRMRKLPVT